jgi:hypothetical protein
MMIRRKMTFSFLREIDLIQNFITSPRLPLHPLLAGEDFLGKRT